MALLDTLKSSLSFAGSAIGKAVAPVTSPIISTGLKALSSLSSSQNAASSRPTSTTSQNMSKTPTPISTPSLSTLSKYTPGAISTANQAVKNMSVQPQASTQPTTQANPSVSSPSVNPNFNFAPVTYGSDTQSFINSSNASRGMGSTPTTPQTPTAPKSLTPPPTGYVNQPSPSANDGILKSLEDAIMKSYAPSEEELRARNELNDIQRQAAEVRSGLRSGLTKIEGQPITMSLLRGQGQELQRQGQDTLNAITDSAMPLQARLEALVADRTGQQNALTQQRSFEMERINQANAEEAARQKGLAPIAVGGNLLALNPSTGQYEVIYESPANRQDGDFTLSEGQLRFDSQGNLIASGGAKSSGASTDKITMVNGQPFTFSNGVLTPVSYQGGDTNNKTKVSTIDSLLGAVDSVLNHPGLSSRVGWQGGLPATPGTQGADFDSRLDFMKAQFERMGVDLLRGLGAMSEGERQAMTKSFSTISRTQSEEEFRNELNRIKETFQKQRSILEQNPTNNYGGQSLAQMAGISDNDYNLLRNAGYSDQEIAQRFKIPFNNAPSKALNGSAINDFMTAIARQESGGRYNAIGPTTAKGQRAFGKYQVMDFNIPSWTKAALGVSLTPQQFLNSPEAQEAVAQYKFQEIFNKYGNWGDVASVWFSGRPVSQAGNSADVTGTTVPRYVSNILQMMG